MSVGKIFVQLLHQVVQAAHQSGVPSALPVQATRQTKTAKRVRFAPSCDARPASLRTAKPFTVPDSTGTPACSPRVGSLEKIETNSKGVDCQRSTAVRVDLGSKRSGYIHANEIAFSAGAAMQGAASAGSAPIPPRVVTVGQSPQKQSLCERFLIQGLDSGTGLFQFVAPSTHAAPAHSAEQTIIDQLKARIVAAGPGGTVSLDKRYQVTALEEVLGGEPDVRCFRLQAKDLAHPGRVKQIFLTQAGLRFDDNRLRCDEIERASVLMSAHVRRTGLEGARSRVQEPMIVSYSGIGRNATLACYRQALTRLHEIGKERDVFGLVDQILAEGRKAHGPHFVHSVSQETELKKAVLKRYQALRSKQSPQNASAQAGISRALPTQATPAEASLPKSVHTAEQTLRKAIDSRAVPTSRTTVHGLTTPPMTRRRTWPSELPALGKLLEVDEEDDD